MIPSSRILTIRPAFPMGGEVTLRVRQEWLPGLVTAFIIVPGAILYRVVWGDASETTHNAFELAAVEADAEPGEDQAD